MPSGISNAIETLFASDMMANTELAYKTSFRENCSTEQDFSNSVIPALLTGGIWGKTQTTFFIAHPCSKVKADACNDKAEAEVCMGEVRYGYCYNHKCLGGKGEQGDICGTDAGSRCISGDLGKACVGNIGGLGCASNTYCCKGVPDDTVRFSIDVCYAGSLDNSCKVGTAFGYCTPTNTCSPCAKYGAACTVDEQCPDKKYNALTNIKQQCGTNANNDNGSCSSGRCSANRGL
jgi:hypothetical protein